MIVQDSTKREKRKVSNPLQQNSTHPNETRKSLDPEDTRGQFPTLSIFTYIFFFESPPGEESQAPKQDLLAPIDGGQSRTSSVRVSDQMGELSEGEKCEGFK